MCHIWLQKLSGFTHFITHYIIKILLTHWVRVAHICVSKLTIIASDNGLTPGLNQCRNIVNGTLGNKLQWNLHRNSYISIQENVFWKYCLKNGGHCVSVYICWLWSSIQSAIVATPGWDILPGTLWVGTALNVLKANNNISFLTFDRSTIAKISHIFIQNMIKLF